MSQLLFNYDSQSKSLLVQFVDASQGNKVIDSASIAPAELDGFLTYVTQAVTWVKGEAAKLAPDQAPKAVSFAGDQPDPAPVEQKEATVDDLKKSVDELAAQHKTLVGALGFGPFGGGGILGPILGPILGGGGGGWGGGGGPWGPRPAPVVVVAPHQGGFGGFGGFGGNQPVWGAGGYQPTPVIVAPQGGGYQTLQVSGVAAGTQVYQGLQLQAYVNGQPSLLQFL